MASQRRCRCISQYVSSCYEVERDLDFVFGMRRGDFLTRYPLFLELQRVPSELTSIRRTVRVSHIVSLTLFPWYNFLPLIVYIGIYLLTGQIQISGSLPKFLSFFLLSHCAECAFLSFSFFLLGSELGGQLSHILQTFYSSEDEMWGKIWEVRIYSLPLWEGVL